MKHLNNSNLYDFSRINTFSSSFYVFKIKYNYASEMRCKRHQGPIAVLDAEIIAAVSIQLQ